MAQTTEPPTDEDDPEAGVGVDGDGDGDGEPAEVESAESTATVVDPTAKARKRRKEIIEWVVVIGGAVILALVVRLFLFQSFYIPSPSMHPTLVENDRVMVNKLSYKLHPVHRGDIVVFDRPPGVPPTDKELIKRVIGLSGETVSLKDGHVYINGKELSEPYVEPGSVTNPLPPADGCSVNLETPLTVPKNHVFVMGDNRQKSLDSRCFGAIPESTIVGRAFVLIWPFSHFSWL
jgi:signal peptidase I